MHSYSIDKNIRGKTIITLFIVSILASTLITAILGNIITEVGTYLKKIQWLTDFIDMFRRLGLTSNYIGVPFLYSLLYWAFDNYIWKLSFIIKMHKVPNLNGKWIGCLTSSYNNIPIEMKMEVIQTWNKISFRSVFPNTNSKSESNTATVLLESNGVTKIGFGFVNHSRFVSQQQYDGYNILDLEDDRNIFGRYFNNRDNQNVNSKGGNKGIFELKKQIDTS